MLALTGKGGPSAQHKKTLSSNAMKTFHIETALPKDECGSSKPVRLSLTGVKCDIS